MGSIPRKKAKQHLTDISLLPVKYVRIFCGIVLLALTAQLVFAIMTGYIVRVMGMSSKKALKKYGLAKCYMIFA